MNKKTLIVAVALVAQVVAICWLIWRYERIVSQGKEVRFACQAYDPYDPLRGRYLRVQVQQECTNVAFNIEKDDGIVWGCRKEMAVRIEPAASNGLWKVVEIAEQSANDGVWLNGRTVYFNYRLRWSDRLDKELTEDFEARRKASGVIARVDMPDQLFLNEKLAPEAERVLWKATGKSAVAVYRVLDGEIVITDIEIDGKPIAQLVKEQK